MEKDDPPNLPNLHGPFVDLEISYAFGNKAALYDAIARSNELGQGLPNWARIPLQELVVEKWKPRLKQWKGSRPPPPLRGGYKELLAHYVRAEVYRSVMLWVENKHHFKSMPTKCIQDWYDGKLENLPDDKESAALEVAGRGLTGTFVALTATSTFKRQRYLGAIPKADKLKVDNPEMAEYLEMTPKEYQAYIASSFRENRRLQLTFGYNETEVIFGLRPPGQFWGPPGDPPEHIRALLEREPKPNYDK